MKRDLYERASAFALRIIKLCQVLDEKPGVSRTLSSQLLRSGTAIGANIAEGYGSQSEADFLHKYSIANKEAYETLYWLDLLEKAEIVPNERLASLRQESNELVSILATICKRLKQKRQDESSERLS